MGLSPALAGLSAGSRLFDLLFQETALDLAAKGIHGTGIAMAESKQAYSGQCMLLQGLWISCA